MILIYIGINPGLTAAYTGHHYSGPGNHFWKCLFMSGLIPSPMNAYDDYKLIHYGIGFTNIVERTTRGSGDLSKKEIQEGAVTLTEKLRRFQPKIAVFNGKGIYEIFVGHKNFIFGKQPDFFPDVENTHVFVMPNSSARCSQLPRAADKLPFYTALKKLRDFLKGEIMRPHENELTFPDLQLKVFRKEKKVDGEASADTKTQSKAPPQQIPNGGTQRLNSQHHSLIQEAMMMSADAGQTDSNSPDARNLAQQYPNNPQGNLMHQQSGEMQGHGMGTTQQNDMFSHQQSQNQVRSPYFTQGHNEQFQNMYQQYMPRPQFFSQVKSENPSSASGSFTQNSEHAYQLAQGSGQQQFYQQQLTNQGHPQQQGYLQQQGNTVQNGNAQLPNNLQEYRGAQTGPNPGQIHPQVVEHPQQQQISPHYGQSREGHSAAQQLYHQQQWQQQQQQQQQGYHQQPNYQHQNYNQFQGYSGGMNTHQRMCQQRPQLQFIKKEPQVDPEEFKRWQNTQGDLQQFRNSQQEYFSQHVKPEMNSPVQQYPQQGYLQQGYTQHGYTPHSHIQQGHPHQGHMQQLHPHQGHMQQAHPHQGQGHPQQGFPPQVHTQQVHHQPVHTDHGPPQQGQTQQGYSQQGHPPQGQTQQGYSQRGHPQQGQTQQGYSQQGHPQQGQTQQGYTQQGHIQQGYPQQGQTQQVQSQQGHAQLRNTQQGHPQQSHPQQGPPQQGHPQQGHPKQNHPQQGHPQQGYPQQSHPDPQQIASQQEQGQFNQGNFYPLQNSAPNQGQGHHPNPGTGLQPENGNIQPWLPFIKSEKDVNSGDLNQGHVSAQEGNNHQGMQGFNANMPLVRDQIQNPMNRKEEPNIERVNSSPVKPQNDVNIAEQEKQLLSIKQELDTEVCNDDHNTQIHNDAQQGGVQAIVIKPEPGDGSQEKNQLPVPSEVTTPSVTNSDNQNQSVADLFCS